MDAVDRGGAVQYLKLAAVPLSIVLFAVSVPAHDGEVHQPSIWLMWSFDPWIVASLVIPAVVYIVGLRRLWRTAESGSGISRLQAAAFAAGWVSLAIALLSPLHPLGELLFAAHMMQHEILMLVSAPLMVLGRPLIAAVWAMPPQWRKTAGSIAKQRRVAAVWSFITGGFAAWAIHAVILWAWHIPALFQATLRSDLIHTVQHASFFGSALLFWWAVLYGPRGAMNYGAGVLYLFTTSIHSGVLGAFLAITTTVWYPAYAETAPSWGLTPIEDQQLGGLIMWMPAGLIYIAAGLTMLAAWLRESEKSVIRRENQAQGPERS